MKTGDISDGNIRIGFLLILFVVGAWPANREILLTSLATMQPVKGEFVHVFLLGDPVKAPLEFMQDGTGLKAKLPAAAPCKYAYTLKITGLKMNPSTNTPSGNPL